MKIKSKLSLTIPFILGIAFNAQAEKISLNYDGFFDRMDDLNAPEYQNVKLAFYLKNKEGQACKIESAELATKLVKKDVYFLDSGELLLPFDEKLDQEKASLNVTVADNQNCSLTIQLESSQLHTNSLKVKDAKHLVSTFDTALKDLAGMMSFLTPDVNGITVVGTKGQIYTAETMFKLCQQTDVCVIDVNELNNAMTNNVNSIEFSENISKILPYIAK